MEHERKKVLVGMSGGIDSSAVCLMLLDEGYEVVGVTMRVWDLPRQFADTRCPDFGRPFGYRPLRSRRADGL